MEPDLCITFLEHPTFTRDIVKFHKKHDDGSALRHLKNLLSIQFHPLTTKRQIILTPKVLRRVDRIGANIEVYKVIMRVKGLSSGQSPRVCFRCVGNLIIFLCFGTHIDNYKDSELKEEIKLRIQELDPEATLA